MPPGRTTSASAALQRLHRVLMPVGRLRASERHDAVSSASPGLAATNLVVKKINLMVKFQLLDSNPMLLVILFDSGVTAEAKI